jgi:hypothetical protein
MCSDAVFHAIRAGHQFVEGFTKTVRIVILEEPNPAQDTTITQPLGRAVSVIDQVAPLENAPLVKQFDHMMLLPTDRPCWYMASTQLMAFASLNENATSSR